jgi:hypothetical protein
MSLMKVYNIKREWVDNYEREVGHAMDAVELPRYVKNKYKKQASI